MNYKIYLSLIIFLILVICLLFFFRKEGYYPPVDQGYSAPVDQDYNNLYGIDEVLERFKKLRDEKDKNTIILIIKYKYNEGFLGGNDVDLIDLIIDLKNNLKIDIESNALMTIYDTSQIDIEFDDITNQYMVISIAIDDTLNDVELEYQIDLLKNIITNNTSNFRLVLDDNFDDIELFDFGEHPNKVAGVLLFDDCEYNTETLEEIIVKYTKNHQKINNTTLREIFVDEYFKKGCFHNVTKLDLSDNDITLLDENLFSKLQDLQEIDISGNPSGYNGDKKLIITDDFLNGLKDNTKIILDSETHILLDNVTDTSILNNIIFEIDDNVIDDLSTMIKKKSQYLGEYDLKIGACEEVDNPEDSDMCVNIEDLELEHYPIDKKSLSCFELNLEIYKLRSLIKKYREFEESKYGTGIHYESEGLVNELNKLENKFRDSCINFRSIISNPCYSKDCNKEIIQKGQEKYSENITNLNFKSELLFKLENKEESEDSKVIRCLDIDDNSNYLISGGEVGKIIIWDIKKKSIKTEIKIGSEIILSVKFLSFNTYKQLSDVDEYFIPFVVVTVSEPRVKVSLYKGIQKSEVIEFVDIEDHTHDQNNVCIKKNNDGLFLHCLEAYEPDYLANFNIYNYKININQFGNSISVNSDPYNISRDQTEIMSSFDIGIYNEKIIYTSYIRNTDTYKVNVYTINNVDQVQSQKINIDNFNFNTVKLYNHNQILISHDNEVNLVNIEDDQYIELQKYYNFFDNNDDIINDIIFYNKNDKNIIVIVNNKGVITFYDQFRCYSNKYECKSLHFDNNFDNFCKQYSFDDKNIKTEQKIDRALSICSKFIDNECCKLELEKIGYRL